MIDTSKIKRRYFKLTPEMTLWVLDKYIKPEYPEITYSIIPSLSTESIYIKLYDMGRVATVRLSSHPSYKSNLVFHYCSRKTRVPKIVRIFINVIHRLKMKVGEKDEKISLL